MSLGPWFVGNRDPSISDTIEVNGAPVDLSAVDEVRFRARALGSSALLVDQPVSNTLDATGLVRYDWQAGDVAPGGALADPRKLLVWWRVLRGSKSEDVNEAIIEVRAHAPVAAYIELEELKKTLKLERQVYPDHDLEVGIAAASAALDEVYGGPWTLGAAGEARYFTPESARPVDLRAISVVEEVALDTAGGGTYSSVLVDGTDFTLEARSGEGPPWDRLRFLRSGIAWSWDYPRWRRYPWGIDGLRVTGQWGWPEVPAGVKAATSIIATRLFRRTREAPFGIIGLGPEGTTVRAGAIARDPEVAFAMKAPAKRRRLIV